MEFLTILLIAFALGIDSFSACIGIGLCRVSRQQVIKLTIIVAIFHIIMPLLGMLLGNIVGSYIGKLAGVFGTIVLITIGAYYIIQFIIEAYRRKDSNYVCVVDTSILDKRFGTIILAFGVSVDALAVGFGLGAMGMNLILTVVTMGVVAGIMTYSGLMLGRKLGNIAGDYAELVGGVLLISIAGYFLLF